MCSCFEFILRILLSLKICDFTLALTWTLNYQYMISSLSLSIHGQFFVFIGSWLVLYLYWITHFPYLGHFELFKNRHWFTYYGKGYVSFSFFHSSYFLYIYGLLLLNVRNYCCNLRLIILFFIYYCNWRLFYQILTKFK